MSATPNGYSPFIQVTGLRKTYRLGAQVVHAVDGVDLEIDEGEFVMVIGPSGSGKSTLMYLLGGLDRATEGSVIVGGREIEKLDENALAHYRREQIGFIFQSFNLIPTMTAEENVAYPLRFSGASRAERRTKARALLERVGLADRVHHRPTELSGGEQQRVAIARALIHRPTIIMADEPTGNLDTASGKDILNLLRDLNHQGHTILMVTHDPRGGQYASRTLKLLDGKIVGDE